jgi:hypothetical protein
MDTGVRRYDAELDVAVAMPARNDGNENGAAPRVSKIYKP